MCIDINLLLIKCLISTERTNYENNYSISPEFKAGLSEGKITVTEVGDIKREIAYHGEVLHSAARLEKMCNNLNQKLLVTEILASQLPSKNSFIWN